MRAFDQPATVLMIENEEERARVRKALALAISALSGETIGDELAAKRARLELESMLDRLQKKS